MVDKVNRRDKFNKEIKEGGSIIKSMSIEARVLRREARIAMNRFLSRKAVFMLHNPGRRKPKEGLTWERKRSPKRGEELCYESMTSRGEQLQLSYDF